MWTRGNYLLCFRFFMRSIIWHFMLKRFCLRHWGKITKPNNLLPQSLISSLLLHCSNFQEPDTLPEVSGFLIKLVKKPLPWRGSFSTCNFTFPEETYRKEYWHKYLHTNVLEYKYWKEPYGANEKWDRRFIEECTQTCKTFITMLTPNKNSTNAVCCTDFKSTHTPT